MLSGCAPAARFCAMSPVLSKHESGPLPQKLLARYLLLLRLYPVLTKAVSRNRLTRLLLWIYLQGWRSCLAILLAILTMPAIWPICSWERQHINLNGPPPQLATGYAFLSALGSLLSQIIEKSRKKKGPSKSFGLGEPLRFATYGFLFTGPLSHYFYLYLDQLFPSDVPFSTIKRLLLDRVIVAPAFLLLFFYVMNLLEGKDTTAFKKRISSGYWPALKMNWKMWTPVQFINVKYVPVQFRVLFGNLVALFWFAYLASVKK